VARQNARAKDKPPIQAWDAWLGAAFRICCFRLLENAVNQNSLRRTKPAKLRMPEPNRKMLLGSGVVPVVVVLVVVVAAQLSIKLSSKVTAPLSAIILPQLSDAPVFSVSLATAMMVPSN
jgi:hypothetical protein